MQKSLGYIFTLLLIFTFTLDAKSLLYKVSSKTSTVYVLGSIHLAKPELYPLNQEITQAYKNSDVLVVEVDPSSPEAVETMQQAIMSLGMYKNGKTLQTELTPKTYKALEAYTKKTNIPLAQMQIMRPWVVMVQLTITEMMRLGYSPELGIDQHFLNLAMKDKKEVLELETAAQQMALLSKENPVFQDKLLFYTLESMQDLEPMLDDMYKGWKRGDEKAFEKIMMTPVEEDPSLKDMYDELITKRNYGMTKKIEGFLKTNKDYFVVVGSGHVIGEEGIVSLLRKHGFRVNQR
jgi:uncharacterized protein YbaP (TraB family)